MALDPKKITAKTAEAINAAVGIAKETGNPQLAPVHLAVALFDDPQGEGGCNRSTRGYAAMNLETGLLLLRSLLPLYTAWAAACMYPPCMIGYQQHFHPIAPPLTCMCRHCEIHLPEARRRRGLEVRVPCAARAAGPPAKDRAAAGGSGHRQRSQGGACWGDGGRKRASMCMMHVAGGSLWDRGDGEALCLFFSKSSAHSQPTLPAPSCTIRCSALPPRPRRTTRTASSASTCSC